ncbi:metal ABC transporter solute-binding protein, Zn/Mn family [Candidatus Paracaedibacter symbiosus]|uniref:metal ABC transporter solute-binding protein, Zn/Mn family n=1 Tax=Candidatus Paracaedibacter symbiosus TaxID=244582 RepID=UPI000509C6D9|nr:zinc ABC transporter substrate-binding protein [Candidatus Paracaedibacter symbiosus]
MINQLISLILACGVIASSAEAKLKVVASFSVLGDLARQIGGDDVEVDIIVPENADPHVYQPKPLDVKKLNQADLVIVNGLGFEGWFDRLISNSGYKSEVIIAAKQVKSRVLHDSNGVAAEDPHAWHNVKNVILYVGEIKTALQQKLPQQTDILEKRALNYIKELEALDAWVQAEFNAIPSDKRKVITTHDAFAYFGVAYGIEFLSPVGVSTDAEPSAAKIAELIKTIKKQDIHAVFIENLSSRKLIEQIAMEANVVIGGVLYADSLSDSKASESPAKTYMEMIRHNALTIHKALIS